MSTSWICVDASLVIRLLVDPAGPTLQAQWATWEVEGYQLAAPTLLYYEVTNAIFQYERHQLLSKTTTLAAIESALVLPIKLYGEHTLHFKAQEIARRFSLNATYDAHYLALATTLGGQLWTADQRLYKAVYNSFSRIALWQPAANGD